MGCWILHLYEVAFFELGLVVAERREVANDMIDRHAGRKSDALLNLRPSFVVNFSSCVHDVIVSHLTGIDNSPTNLNIYIHTITHQIKTTTAGIIIEVNASTVFHPLNLPQ